MSKDYTTLRVTEAAKERAEASKTEGETWSDYIDRCTDNPPEVREFADVADLKDQISMANEPSVQIDAADIIGRIEDLEARLPRKVAEEVHQR